MKGGEDLYERYLQLITERNITTYKVAKDTGISTVTFCDWKHGRSKPKIDKLKTLASYFGVSVDYFIYE